MVVASLNDQTRNRNREADGNDRTEQIARVAPYIAMCKIKRADVLTGLQTFERQLFSVDPPRRDEFMCSIPGLRFVFSPSYFPFVCCVFRQTQGQRQKEHKDTATPWYRRTIGTRRGLTDPIEGSLVGLGGFFGEELFKLHCDQ